MKEVRIKLYPGARHELLEELNHQEVFEDIADFITPDHPGIRNQKARAAVRLYGLWCYLFSSGGVRPRMRVSLVFTRFSRLEV